MSNPRLNLLFKEIILFLLTQALGLFVASKLWEKRVIEYVPIGQTEGFTLVDFLFAFVLSTAFIVIFLKLSRKSSLLFELMFVFSVFVGADIVFEALLPQSPALVLAVIVALLRFLAPKVWTQNLVIVISVAGVAAWLGLNMTLEVVISILILLSIYDVIAVYKTKHMVTMMKGLMERGVYFAIIVPEKTKNLLSHLGTVRPGEGFMFLGTGDIAFPLILAVSALKYNFVSSIAIIIGALLGIIAVHILFITQRERRPMPALPPIVLGAIVGFLVSRII